MSRYYHRLFPLRSVDHGLGWWLLLLALAGALLLLTANSTLG